MLCLTLLCCVTTGGPCGLQVHTQQALKADMYFVMAHTCMAGLRCRLGLQQHDMHAGLQSTLSNYVTMLSILDAAQPDRFSLHTLVQSKASDCLFYHCCHRCGKHAFSACCKTLFVSHIESYLGLNTAMLTRRKLVMRRMFGGMSVASPTGWRPPTPGGQYRETVFRRLTDLAATCKPSLTDQVCDIACVIL